MADDSRPDEKSFVDGRAQDYLVCATKRVLIVDDEPLVVAVLRDFFAALQQGEFFASFEQGRAYEVTTALAVADALDILRRERFDIILLDTSMPGRWQAPRFRPSRWPGRQVSRSTIPSARQGFRPPDRPASGPRPVVVAG